MTNALFRVTVPVVARKTWLKFHKGVFVTTKKGEDAFEFGNTRDAVLVGSDYTRRTKKPTMVEEVLTG